MQSGLKHIHTSDALTLVARTARRDLWDNTDSPLTALFKGALWVGAGYSCISSVLALTIPWLLKHRQPQSVRNRRPLYNTGWDTVHHIISRVAAFAPGAQVEVRHLADVSADPAWGLRVEVGPDEVLQIRLDVDEAGKGPRLTALIEWSGVGLIRYNPAALAGPWSSTDGGLQTRDLSGRGGLHFRGRIDHGAMAADQVPVEVGRWFGELILATGHGPRLAVAPSGASATLTRATRDPNALAASTGRKSTILTPSHPLVAQPRPLDRACAWLASFFAKDVIVVGMLLNMLMTSTFIMVGENSTLFILIPMCVTLLGIVWWMGMSAYGRASRPSDPREALVLDGTSFGIEGGARVDLSRPFNVELTRSATARAPAVGIEVRQKGEDGAVRSVAFQVSAKDTAALQSIPALDRSTAWLSTGALKAWVWPALQSHALLHGARIPWDFE